jgi:hypothetical protein
MTIALSPSHKKSIFHSNFTSTLANLKTLTVFSFSFTTELSAPTSTEGYYGKVRAIYLLMAKPGLSHIVFLFLLC